MPRCVIRCHEILVSVSYGQGIFRLTKCTSHQKRTVSMQINKIGAFSALLSVAGLSLIDQTAGAAVLSFQDLGPGLTSTSGPTGQGTAYTTLPATDTFGNSFGCQACSSSVLVTGGSPSNTYNFYDDFEFTVASATIDAVSSTINLKQLLEVDNLQMRVYTAAGNSPPVVTGPVSGLQAGWSTPVNFTAGTESGEISALSDVMLGAGTYILEVRGDVVGTSGGSYSGNLNLAPVPLPAALPLLLSGLGLLGGLVRKRFV